MIAELVIAYMRERLLSTALNIALLALSVAALVLLLIASSQIGERLERNARGVDLVVGAKGSPLQLILSSIYQIDRPTGNIPLSALYQLRRDPGVARVIPLALGDAFRGYRIVGTEPAYLSLYGAQIAAGQMFAGQGDCVVGAEAARDLGLTVGQRFIGGHGMGEEAESGSGAEHVAQPFTVTAILKPTGTVADRLIVTSVDTIWHMHGVEAPAVDAEPDDSAEAEITALLVTYRNAAGAVRLPMMINRQTNMQSAVPAIETNRLLSLLGVGIDGAMLFGWLLALIGGLSIFVAMLNAANAREGDLALLRVMGATRGQVFGTILMEGTVTAVLGACVGALTAHLVLAQVSSGQSPLAQLGLEPWRWSGGEVVIVAIVVGIGAITALVPAMRIFTVNLAETLGKTGR
ncbi:ABC transporter permease [Novosphingobium sp.]|uniref:ABC transporter permease n=1 Tax=Novosphingobium sp. TaxID=1874826 RepID=UPI00262B88B4|nr:ABC transporter permease [Novosphingobium sp.]